MTARLSRLSRLPLAVLLALATLTSLPASQASAAAPAVTSSGLPWAAVAFAGVHRDAQGHVDAAVVGVVAVVAQPKNRIRVFDDPQVSATLKTASLAALSELGKACGYDGLASGAPVYVNGDPVNLVDPDGHRPLCIDCGNDAVYGSAAYHGDGVGCGGGSCMASVDRSMKRFSNAGGSPSHSLDLNPLDALWAFEQNVDIPLSKKIDDAFAPLDGPINDLAVALIPLGPLDAPEDAIALQRLSRGARAAGEGIPTIGDLFGAARSRFSEAALSKSSAPVGQDLGAGRVPRSLYHYTDRPGQAGILSSRQLWPSLKSLNPADARYGNGQYLSDVEPGSMSCAQLSRCFLGQPFQGARFTHYVEINVEGLDVERGRDGVYVVPGDSPLDLVGRIVRGGGN